jgi:hypothetical protein
MKKTSSKKSLNAILCIATLVLALCTIVFLLKENNALRRDLMQNASVDDGPFLMDSIEPAN